MDEARLGRYVVLRRLASGGMADVMLARVDGVEGVEGFERHVVVKRIKAAHAKDQRFISMFLDEARVASTLHHANIVQVHDIGEADGEYFLAMEYIHGEDLRRILSAVARQRTHLPLGNVLAIVSAVAAGLHHAHERRGSDKKPLGIVHRDVSPSNILCGFDGSVKVVDFGIAKVARSAEESTPRGKLAYMSPEQCTGGAVDRRSDIYSLGVVMYELATTTRLFKAASDDLVMDAIVHGKVPLPRIRRPDLPNELSTIIMRALALDPARRYQTADELRIAVDEYTSRTGAAVTPAALGAHVHKLFGDKPEPWLDRGRASVRIDPDAKYSWTELSSAGEGTGSDVLRRRATRTSAKWAYEQTPNPSRQRGSGAAKVAMIGLPLLAIAGVATWHFALRQDDTPVAASDHVAPAPAPTPTPVVAPDAAVAAESNAPAPAPAPAPQPSRRTMLHGEPVHAGDHPSEPAVYAPVAAPAPTEPDQSAPPPPPPPSAPAPEPAAPMIGELSEATVQMAANDHAAQLTACGGGDDVRGDVTVTFEIDAAGKVVKSQVGSTIKNPKLAACFLRAVQSWHFPRPPAGAAHGTYKRTYQ